MNRRSVSLAASFLLAASPAWADELKAVLELNGHVAASCRAAVPSAVTGLVADVQVAEGDVVKKGQPLAALDDSAVKADLRVAEARVKLASVKFEAEKAANAVERAKGELQVRRAKADLDRVRKLGPAASPAESEALDLALAAAELQLKSVADGGGVAVARAEVDVSRAELERVARRLEATRVRAPIDGVVIRRSVAVGEFVRAGDAVVEIADLNKLVAVAEVPDRDLAKIAVGQPCRLTFGTGDAFIQASVTAISPVSDPAKNMTQVRLEFPTRKDVARIGGVVRVSFLQAAK